MGPDKGSLAGLHFNQNHIMLAGRRFCETLADLTRDEERVNKAITDLNKRYP